LVPDIGAPEKAMRSAKSAVVKAGEPRIIERPDGFWWVSEDGRRECGPFRTLVDAELDMENLGDDTGFEPGETLAEAEDEIGINGWIDPDTGQPAEDVITRTEDH